LSQKLGLGTGEWFSHIEWTDVEAYWTILLSALQEGKLPRDVLGIEIKVVRENLINLKVLVKNWNNEGTEKIGESLWKLGLRCNLQVKIYRKYNFDLANDFFLKLFEL
jgi:hypothetical protein